MDFAHNLVFLRKAANLSQDKLAEQLHITRQAVSKWESGASTPDLDTVMKLCLILDVTPNQLLVDCHTAKSVGEPATRRSGGLSFIVSAAFLMVMFVCGVVLLIVNFYNGVLFEPNMTLIALSMMSSSLLGYILMTLARIGICKRKAKEEQS